MSEPDRKLQIKDQAVRVIGAPAGFSLDARQTDAPGAGAVIVFVHDRAELDAAAAPVLEAARADRLAWIAYPKGGQLGTDLNRDSLAAALSGRGVRPVRQIAIDDVWSALRLRPDARDDG